MNETIQRPKVEERIASFLRQSTSLTLATCADNVPYCASCFYVYDEEKNLLIFKSNPDTKHIRQAMNNNSVAGTITPDKLDAASVRGIQFAGLFLRPENEFLESVKGKYYSKYPFARAFPGSMWVIELWHIKMTDSTLGFGTKTVWSAEDPSTKN